MRYLLSVIIILCSLQLGVSQISDTGMKIDPSQNVDSVYFLGSTVTAPKGRGDFRSAKVMAGYGLTWNLVSFKVDSTKFATMFDISGLATSAALTSGLAGKQATLVSGTNIKTINGSTILGSGDLVVGGSAAWGSITGTLSSQTDLQSALDLKANLASPTFTGTVIAPLIVGGTATTSDLFLQTTTGVGASGADMHFLTNNNGSIEAMTILNSGAVGINTTAPSAQLHIIQSSEQLRVGYNTSNYWNATTNSFGGVTFDAIGALHGFSFSDKVGIGTVASANLHSLSTTEQLRIGYDASNYYSTTVSSTGSPTFDAVGTSPTFTFSDAISATNLSGTNTGDNSANTLYSGLVSNATHTGDATGATALTLATVNSNVGSFGTATQSGTFTVNGKGLITAASNTTIAIPESAVTSLTTDLGLKANLASPTFTTSIISPLVIGGTATTSDLFLQTTNATGTTGADMHMLVGANGGTEAITILNNGKVGIGFNAPTADLAVGPNNSGAGTTTPVWLSLGRTYGTNTIGQPGNIKFAIYDDGSNRYGVGISAGMFEFQTAGTTDSYAWFQGGHESMRITGSGTSYRLGIATSAPDKQLEVNLGTASAFRLSYNDSNGSAAVYKDETISSTGVVTVDAVGTGQSFVFSDPVVLKGYTVATLPTGVQGMTAFVTDALTPTFLTIVVGGGAVVSPVFYNGTNWVSQ